MKEKKDTKTPTTLLAKGNRGDKSFRLEDHKGVYRGSLYRSGIEPYYWVLNNIMGMADFNEDLDVLTKKNNIVFSNISPVVGVDEQIETDAVTIYSRGSAEDWMKEMKIELLA